MMSEFECSSGRSERDTVRALYWTEAGLCVLDQRRLPEEIVHKVCTNCREVVSAISMMLVRGAPAIGIAAAYGVALAARDRFRINPSQWKQALEADFDALAASRPTAVNLFWALNRMRAAVQAAEGDPLGPLLALAQRIHAEDIAANRAMGSLGAAAIGTVDGVLTHCNTGSLATGGFGTALGVIRTLFRQQPLKIFATETRPWLQGARLTLWELAQDRIPATLLADSAAAYLMSLGRVQWVIVGADRIAANGDTANKIGTYALALLARHHGVRFMVVAPTATIDWSLTSGREIRIEQRNKSELLGAYFAKGEDIDAWNPVFDVTPSQLIDVLVTETGVVWQPDSTRMQKLQSG